jgi:hypothetical protein
LQLDGDLVKASEKFQVCLEVREDSEVLWLEGDVDSVLGTWEELASGRDGVEVGDFGEVEVDCEVLILVLDRQVVVSALILGTLSKGDALSADLDVRVTGTSHHLYF